MLRSTNPFDKPLIYAGYFTHPEDIKVFHNFLWLINHKKLFSLPACSRLDC